MSLTYSNYLKLPELLRLQNVQSDPPQHDETLFIIIHQVYELWFKLLLHEFDKIKRDFSSNDLYGASATLKRTRTIMKTLVAQLDILETMTPMSFLSFRDRLAAASGFQSAQFRELEFLLGHKRPELLKFQEEGSPDRSVLERRLNEPSLVDHFYDFLEHRGVQIPAELRDKDIRAPSVPHERIQQGLINLYRTQPDVANLLEQVTDFDEGLQEWRYRHVKMVERTIGHRQGTGGSPGVEFLKESLFKPIFPDLWEIRDKL
ncbi:MAG: tryptophan 2,3-dioxygenase [Planctomycetes bacterium]|nr:tryptophan 2,3-dioxygenase [Planctomycetota bacterium]